MALQLRRGTNAERLAITPQQGELIFVTDYLAVNITATTIVGSTDTLTFSAAHNLVVGQKLLYQGVTSFGLTTGTIYFVLSAGLTTTACKLSLTSGGTAVDLTDATAQSLIFNKAPTLANGTPVGNVSPLWIGNGSTVGGVSAQVSVLDDLLDVTLTSIQEGQTLYYDATTAQWKNTGIFTIDDTTNSTNVNITTTDFNLLTRTNSNTDLMSPTLELRTMTTATPLAGYGSAINFSANNTAGAVKQLGSVGVNYTDLGVGAEDANFKVKVMKNGVSPLSPESTFIHQFRVESTGDILTAKNLTLNKDKEFSQSTITFSHPTTDGSITWQGTGHFLSGDLVVQGGSDNQVVIDAPSNTGIANIFNGAIGTTNIGNGSTYLNLGGLTAGTRTHIKSPILDLVGDILVGGNEIKTGNYDSQTGVFSNQQTAITLAGIDVTVEGELKVDGNKIKSVNADALTFSSSDVTVVGDLTVGGSGVQSDIIASKSVGSLYIATPTVYVGTGSANTVVDIGGVNTLTTLREDVVVVGDLAVNGDNGGAYADITTTKNQAQLFPLNALTVKLAESATNISMGATTGTTTIRNNAVITGDATVNGGNINLNGSATAATQPFITFAQQADGSNSLYGIRGTSTVDDAWFVGSGSAGDDLGYLEIATGDNLSGGGNSGGQIYVRQYNGWNSGGVPWYGGSGTIVNTLTLLDANGNTDIPNNLNLGLGSITTPAQNARIFSDGGMPDTIDMGASATAISFGNVSGTGTTTVRNSLVVSGDLTVNGTTTTVNSTTLTVDDKNIEMGSVASPTDTTASGGGITLKGATDKTIIWNNATNGWELNQSVKVAGDLQINGGDFSTGLLNNRLYANRQSTDLNLPSRALVLQAASYTNQTTLATPQIGAGSALGFNAHTSTSSGVATFKEAAYISVGSTNITPTEEAFDMTFGLMNSGDTYATKLKLTSTGDLTLYGGSLTLGNNTIKSSNGTTAIETTSTGDIIVTDDIFAKGNVIQFNYGTTGTPTLGVGFQVERGDLANVEFGWSENIDRWIFTNDGTNYTNLPVATDSLTYAGLTTTTNLTSNGNTTLGSDANDTVTVNGLISGNITFAFNDTATPKGILGKTVSGADDFWFIGGAKTGADAGYAMIATGDNGTEPIYVRQYNGSPISGTVATGRELTLLDGSGNTTIPNILTVNGGDNSTPSINTTGTISVGGNIYGYGNYGMFLNGSSVVVNNNVSGAPTNNGEFSVGRGNAATTKLVWNESTDRWTFTNDGTNYTNLPVATDKPTYAGLNVTASIDSTSGALQLGTASNNHIKLTPNGTGNVLLESSTVGIGDTSGNLSGNLTTNGAGDLILNTNNSNNSGSITITNGVNGAITLAPNGTGVTNVTGNLQVSGNTIKSSSDTALTLSGTNVTVAGDLTVGGNDIKSANGTTALTLADTTGNVTVAGDLFVTGNSILSSGGYSNLQFTNSDVEVVGDLTVTGNDIKSSTGATAISLNGTDVSVGGDLTIGGDLRINGNDIKASNNVTNITLSSNSLTTFAGDIRVNGNDIQASDGNTNITLTSNSLTTFAGDIKLGGNTVYDSSGNNVLDFKTFSSIYGTSYQAKFNTSVNYGLSASYLFIDNMVEMNTSSLTTTSTSTAVLDYFDETSYRSAKYLIQITNGSSHQIWEGMMIHDGTNIFITAYGDLRTGANLATVSAAFNVSTGHPELRVTPVNATQTKFKATKTYIAV